VYGPREVRAVFSMEASAPDAVKAVGIVASSVKAVNG
jgi:hypothetical protein